MILEVRIKFNSLIGFIFVFSLWDIISYRNKDPAIPRLKTILSELFNMIQDKYFYENILASLQIICLGLIVATILGFVLGIFIFQFKFIRESLMPVVEAIRGVAALTLFPLLISTMGLGIESRVFIICWTAWPAVLIQTVYSLGDIDKSIIEAGVNAGASNWIILTKIRIPIAKNSIMTGIKIGISGGWIGLIASEMLGATKGLGYYLLWSAQSFEYPKVYAIILTIAFLGWTMNTIVNLIDKKLYEKGEM